MSHRVTGGMHGPRRKGDVKLKADVTPVGTRPLPRPLSVFLKLSFLDLLVCFYVDLVKDS